MNKKLKLKVSLPLKPLAVGLGGCVVSNRISVDGMPVGLMQKEATDRKGDSGWSFLAGDETEAYLEDTNNAQVFDVNIIANHDPAIVPYLKAAEGTLLKRAGKTIKFDVI